jgi:DNA-binding NarL/FixJ family response regulator
MAIRVLLADDHPLIMAGFASLLKGYQIESVGEALTPEAAVEKYRQLGPDVAVFDIRFGDAMTGLDAGRQIIRQFPRAKIVFLSQFDQPTLVRDAYQIGAYAFLNKSCHPQQLADAIESAQQEKRHFPPKIAEQLALLSVEADLSPRARLNATELEIFVLMAKGMTQVKIANALNVSVKTISNKCLVIKDKLGAHHPSEITKLAIKHELIKA